MTNIRTALLVAGFIGFSITAAPFAAQAQDCDAMIGEIDEQLKTADLTDEEKEKVMQIRDEGMAENTSAGGDCTSTLQEALDMLKE